MNEPLTYEDFISQVGEAMPLDSPFRISDRDSEPMKTEEVKTANKDFQFEDIEIGKIYVFWSNWDTWFLSPTSIREEDYYSVYWCYYNPGPESWEDTSNGKIIPKAQSDGEDLCGAWEDYVWSGKRWKVLIDPLSFKDDPLSFKDVFINWDKLPRGDKQ